MGFSRVTAESYPSDDYLRVILCLKFLLILDRYKSVPICPFYFCFHDY